MSSSNSGHQEDDGIDSPGLDVQKLHSLPSEQQDLYLFSFTAHLVRYIESLDSDGISAKQKRLTKELFRIITLPSPAPSNVVRTNICQCFSAIHRKGDRKSFFETVNELGNILTGKGERDRKTKHAAASCIGAVFEAAGESAISLASFAISNLLRALKTAHNYPGFRGSIFEALARIIEAVGSSADESVTREAWKQARSAAANDKAYFVQSKACSCLERLTRATEFFDNSNDFEKLQGSLWRCLDSPSTKVRRSAAACVAAVLAKGFSELSATDALPAIKKLKKPVKKQTLPEGEEETDERPDSPAHQRPATRLTFNFTEVLDLLSSQYSKASASNRLRAGLALCYVKTFQALGAKTVESHYGQIALHLFNDILSATTITQQRFRQLTARRYVRVILEDVIGIGMLGEEGQIMAAEFLVRNVIKDYPQTLKERSEPSKQALVGALSALAALIQNLGSAATAFAESSRDSLIRVLQHPSYSVQVQASLCLRCLIFHCPQQIQPTLTSCLSSVRRELAALGGPRNSSRGCVGLANGLAASIRASSLHSLYGSVDLYANILAEAVSLLKTSGASDLRLSSTQIQAAWILIGGLMSLGPNFVKIHLAQLLLLWRNALAKPPSRETMAQSDALEVSFLAHVRECALGAILSFLEFNGRLLTADVTRRLTAILQNTTLFVNSLPAKKQSDDLSQRLSPSLSLQDFNIMVRRRVLQCYSRLVSLSASESSDILVQSNLLPFVISTFAHPENYAPSSLSASIASSSGSSDGVWDIGDNYGSGITGLVKGFSVGFPNLGSECVLQDHWSSQADHERSIDQSLLSPVSGALEHDAIVLYISEVERTPIFPDPPATEIVNAAIVLFSRTFALHGPKVQESILEQLSSFLSSTSLQRDPARKLAISVNIATAILGTLIVAIKGSYSSLCDLKASAVEKVMQEILHSFVLHHDPYVRNIATESLGLLCNSSGSSLVSTEVSYLIDQIISNREPTARAGCAVAIGRIHAQLGGMAASYHLKNVLGVLMSLCSDPHPTVHFWALQSLSTVADSSGLSFSGHISSTLGMLAQLYISDSHSADADSILFSNTESDHPSSVVIARCVDSMINVLGPDLQDAVKLRDLINLLCVQFQAEDDSLVVLESLKCQEHISLYAPMHTSLREHVRRLGQYLSSDSVQLRGIALDGIHDLMRRDAEAAIAAADPSLENQLWFALDKGPAQATVQSIFRDWLQQSGLSNPTEWIHRCQNVLQMTLRTSDTKMSSNEVTVSALPDIQDEEVASFAAQSEPTRDNGPFLASSKQELLRWQTRAFAIDCVSDLLAMVGKDMTTQKDAAASSALQPMIADLIKVAFSASTASVVELRLRGMQIVDQLLTLFGKVPDPEFAEASLLEQYQAQITSALTPAFAADSVPELAAKAIHVCATFISTGMVKNVERMGRIFKLLVSALEIFASQSEATSIGDMKGLGANSQVMVRMATFSAWAKLQAAASDQDYLIAVVKPYTPKLILLWLSSLTEYARLKFEPEGSMALPIAHQSGNLDSVYAALNRQILLTFYQDSWMEIIIAIASLIDENNDHVFDALDGKRDPADDAKPMVRTTRKRNDEPATFFFLLYGLAFEALASRPKDDSKPNRDQMLDILQSLQTFLRPTVCGNAPYQEAIFSETTDLLDKLVLSEGTQIQSVIVEVARDLCQAHPSSSSSHEIQSNGITEDKLSEDIDQLFELTRLIVQTIVGILPSFRSMDPQSRGAISGDSAALLQLSLSALVDVATVFPSIIKTDLHACILHVFHSIIAAGRCQDSVVPRALPILKRFLTFMNESPRHKAAALIRNALGRFLRGLKYAQRREFEAALACEKNTLLAITILLTSTGSMLSPRDPLLMKLADELFDCLGNRLTTKVAAGCCRTLMALPNRDSTCDMVAAKLLPLLIDFVVNPANVEGLDESRSAIAATLCAFVSTLGEGKRPAAVSLIVPALLARASGEDMSVFSETASQLRILANLSAAGFRDTVDGMTITMKTLMEGIIRKSRAAVTGNHVINGEDSDGDQGPSIALKMEFGVA